MKPDSALKLFVAGMMGLFMSASAAAPAAAARHRAPCPTHGKRVVAVSKRASVYGEAIAGQQGNIQYFGCNRRTRRLVSFNPNNSDDTGGFGISESAAPPVLNGRYAATGVIITGRLDDNQNVVRGYDLVTGRRLFPEQLQYLEPDGTLFEGSIGTPSSLQVNARGDVAWTSPHNVGDLIDVRYIPRGKPVRVLEQSPGVAPESLALAATGVYWTNADGPRWAAR